jgi:small subunit ribosomal protein S20
MKRHGHNCARLIFFHRGRAVCKISRNFLKKGCKNGAYVLSYRLPEKSLWERSFFAMPNNKSASKRVLIAQERNRRNRAARSVLRTSIKKLDAELASGNAAAAKEAYTAAVKTVDRAATKGLIHKNNAARKKSALTAKLAAAK